MNSDDTIKLGLRVVGLAGLILTICLTTLLTDYAARGSRSFLNSALTRQQAEKSNKELALDALVRSRRAHKEYLERSLQELNSIKRAQVNIAYSAGAARRAVVYLEENPESRLTSRKLKRAGRLLVNEIQGLKTTDILFVDTSGRILAN